MLLNLTFAQSLVEEVKRELDYDCFVFRFTGVGRWTYKVRVYLPDGTLRDFDDEESLREFIRLTKEHTARTVAHHLKQIERDARRRQRITEGKNRWYHDLRDWFTSREEE